MGSAAGGMMAAQMAVKTYGDFQAGMSEYEALRANARIKRMQAEDAKNRGGAAAGQLRLQGSQTRAQAKLGLVKSGVELDSAAARSALDTTSAYSELDALTAKANAARAAWGYAVEAEELKRRAKQQQTKVALDYLGNIYGGSASIASASGGGK